MDRHLDHVVLAPSSLLKFSLLTYPFQIDVFPTVFFGLSHPHQFAELVVWNRQEGHTAHATKEEATEMVEAALDLYASACAKRALKIYGLKTRRYYRLK